jgi:putative flippase GtrA/glycosyltransferase involved in cell wall biosynthesis
VSKDYEASSDATVPEGSALYIGTDASGRVAALQELEQLPVRVPEHHQAAQSRRDKLMRQHGFRFMSFSVIGGSVFLAGLALQFALVRQLRMNVIAAYAIQSVVSIEASFLLNRWLTWRDRDAPFWRSLCRFNVSKTITVILNLALYTGLVRLGMNYLVANIALTAAFTVVNYVAGDKFAFRVTAPRCAAAAPSSNGVGSLWGTPVSVVIPCRDNQATIRDAVLSLLDQDYPYLNEVLIVGSPGDCTWAALADIRDPRVQPFEVDAPPGLRDANYKRDVGIGRAASDLIALVDSDVVLPRDWMSTAVAAMDAEGVQCVTGGLKSLLDSFWGRYTDHTVIGAKTPRIGHSYLVTSADFGRAGRKPPITANALFTRELYEACPIDPTWSHGSYEDYEWFWRVTAAGYPIYVSSALYGLHQHRQGWRALAREYRRSSRGCAYFIREHRDSPFAQHRLRQALTLPAVASVATVAVGMALLRGYGTGVAALIIAVLIGICGYQLTRARRLESIAYPAVGLVLGLVFTTGLINNLARPSVIPRWLTSSDKSPALRRRSSLLRLWHPLTAILALQAGYSLILIHSNAAFGDEADFLWTGRLELAHWLHGVAIPKQTDLSQAAQVWPVIGALASDVGGLLAARLLALAFMLTTTVLIYRITGRLFSRTPALMAAALWALSEPSLRLAFATGDGMACMLIVLGAWLILQAADRPRWRGEIIAVTAAVIALGNITAFSFVVYDIFLIPFAFLAWRYLIGTRLATWCSGWLLGGVGVGTAGLMTLLQQWQNALDATANRAVGLGSSVVEIAKNAWSFEGIIFALGAAGALIAIATRDQRRWLLTACALAGWINPAFQARLGTTWSMDKHMAAGVVFLAIPAGYAFTCVTLPRMRAWATAVIAATALSAPAILGMWYAHNTYLSWPNVGQLIRVVQTAQAGSSAPLLVDSSGNFSRYLFDYYLMRGDDWQQIQATGGTSLSLTGNRYAVIVAHFDAAALSDPGLPEDALHYGQAPLATKILALAGNDRLVEAITSSRAYRIYAVIPYETSVGDDSTGVFVVWVRR